MAEPGDVVTLDFPGATGLKRRPAIIVSTRLYHARRPDVIIGVLTSNVAAANTPTDYVLQDWQAAGLRLPTAFRAYLATVERSAVRVIGQLSERDWNAVQECLTRALEVRSAAS